MASSNVETYRAGHEAFNQRNFAAMTKHYADRITWTDHAQGRTFSTPREFQDDFLPGWIASSSEPKIRLQLGARQQPAAEPSAEGAVGG